MMVLNLQNLYYLFFLALFISGAVDGATVNLVLILPAAVLATINNKHLYYKHIKVIIFVN